MPFLTFHRPNFCAECGAKILRIDWRLWTSRKFCDSCGRGLRKRRFTNVVAVSSAIFVAGLMVGQSFRTPPPPLIIQRKEDATATPSEESQQSKTSLPVEEIYTCGARTKKGKPCSRRVHGPVRCWQHKGMKAMLPQEKLRVEE